MSQPDEFGASEPSEGFPHRHELVSIHVLAQKAGVPVQVEQVCCTECAAVVIERTIGRALA